MSHNLSLKLSLPLPSQKPLSQNSGIGFIKFAGVERRLLSKPLESPVKHTEGVCQNLFVRSFYSP